MAHGRTIEDLDRWDLAGLAREYLMAGHLIDRVAMPQVIGHLGAAGMVDVAVEEWSAASPVYTDRIRRLLGFSHEHDVAAMFKGMQFDVGAPHEYLDFRYSVEDAERGGFHLDHCGALLDVEPMGEEYVRAVCHDVEDPTFAATLCASNPRARVWPIHRPPRASREDHPHCEWVVEIDSELEPSEVPVAAERLRSSRLHGLVVPLLPLDDPGGGWCDYRHPLDPDLRMEDFSAVALRALCREFCLQAHLLVLAFSAAVRERLDSRAVVDAVVAAQIGTAGVVAQRLARWVSSRNWAVDPESEQASERLVAQVLELHPMFAPRDYIDVWVDGDGETVVVLGDCAATEEVVGLGWGALLADGQADAAVAAAVEGVANGFTAVTVEAPFGRRRAWRIEAVDRPAEERPEVTLARFSMGADFEFVRVGERLA
jgi:hypothetical protein